MATIVAERFLDKHREQIVYSTSDVLDALGSTVFMSKNLLFLGGLPFSYCLFLIFQAWTAA